VSLEAAPSCGPDGGASPSSDPDEVTSPSSGEASFRGVVSQSGTSFMVEQLKLLHNGYKDMTFTLKHCPLTSDIAASIVDCH